MSATACGCESFYGHRPGAPDCGCGWGDLCDWRAPVTASDWSALTVAQAYAYGRTDPAAPRYRNPRLGVNEARAAVDSWTGAQTDHAETSYWGAHHIRVMRAYWIGRLRTARAVN